MKRNKNDIANDLMRDGKIIQWCDSRCIIEAYGHRYAIERKKGKVVAITQLKEE